MRTNRLLFLYAFRGERKFTEPQVNNIITEYLVTPWIRVLVKLASLQLVKKLPHFMKPEGS
jgi:hypothetical protein